MSKKAKLEKARLIDKIVAALIVASIGMFAVAVLILLRR